VLNNEYLDNSVVVLVMAWKGVNWKGSHNDQRIFYSTFSSWTAGWTPQQVLSDRGTSTSPALANWHIYKGDPSSSSDPFRLDERLYMAWKGIYDDQRIFYSSFDGSTSRWTPQQVLSDRGTSTSPALAVTSNNERLYMAWKGIYDDQRLFQLGVNHGLSSSNLELCHSFHKIAWLPYSN
jgi:hypothetical protein